LRKRDLLSVQNIFLALCVAGMIAAIACTDPLSRKDNAGQLRPKADILIPNIDDDNGDGIPDVNAAPLAVGADDEILQVQIFPDRKLPRGAMVRAEIAEPWTRFARAFIRTSSPDGTRFVPPSVEVKPVEAKKSGVVIGIEAADFAASDRPPTVEVKVVFETREGRPLHEEKVLCSVAPFLLSSCLDPAERIQVVKTKATEQFVRNLEPLVEAAGAKLEIIDDASIPEHDIWIQDAVEILKQADPGGILNRGTKREGDKPGEFERPVADVLRDKRLMAAQEHVQGKIDAVRRTLQDELGVADADIIEIPVLFNSDNGRFRGRYFAETVNLVNGLLVGNDYIVPDPRGPLVDGKDVLLQAGKDRLEPLGCRVVPLDCFYPYHRWGGEIHCGTNATRRRAQKYLGPGARGPCGATNVYNPGTLTRPATSISRINSPHLDQTPLVSYS
jgi:hypothetical protein